MESPELKETIPARELVREVHGSKTARAIYWVLANRYVEEVALATGHAVGNTSEFSAIVILLLVSYKELKALLHASSDAAGL